jgi:hypothetical protein
VAVALRISVVQAGKRAISDDHGSLDMGVFAIGFERA